MDLGQTDLARGTSGGEVTARLAPDGDCQPRGLDALRRRRFLNEEAHPGGIGVLTPLNPRLGPWGYRYGFDDRSGNARKKKQKHVSSGAEWIPALWTYDRVSFWV